MERKNPCKIKVELILNKPELPLEITNNLQCKFCKKIFTRHDNLKVHVDIRCKIKKINKEKENNELVLFNKIKELEQEINILKTSKKQSKTTKTVNNNTNNTNCNNTNIMHIAIIIIVMHIAIILMIMHIATIIIIMHIALIIILCILQ